jgi:hypothetical protein
VDARVLARIDRAAGVLISGIGTERAINAAES